VKFTKKTYLFIGLMSATSIAGQTYYPAKECPLLQDRVQASFSVIPAAAIAPLETSENSPILILSQPNPSRLMDGLTASPPFEAPESIGTVTAGEGVAIAPSRVMPSPAPLPKTEIKLFAEAETDMIKDKPAAAWDAVLSKYVKAPDAAGLARFDYAALKASSSDSAVLKAYIKALEAKGPGGFTENETIAYWANLYNAVTVQVILDNYPVSSIRKIKSGTFSPGPWKKDLVTIAGEKISLDDIEHGTLRKQYPSPHIHYMVNCASVGCPNLKDGLWSAKTLDADRDAAARAFINSPRGARVTPKGLVVSSIYNWFDEDFGGNKAGVLAHLAEYAEGDLKTAIDGGIKISGYDYDWSLNE